MTGVIVYNRDNAIVNEDTLARLCDRNPEPGRLADGVGDVELMMRVYCKLGDRLTYIGGLPTAETFAPAYLEMGVTTLSSAIFNFMPAWAIRFYKAVRARDKATIVRELNAFVLPYIALRNRGRGYAVSIGSRQGATWSAARPVECARRLEIYFRTSLPSSIP